MYMIEEYLNKIESAATTFIKGFHEYQNILFEIEESVFTFWGDDEIRIEKEYKEWAKLHAEEIKSDIENQEKYVTELFAMSTFSGSILQLALMGINMCSKNKVIHPFLNSINIADKKKQSCAKYCIGRVIQDIPIGLIIYAGRNLYNHIDEPKLREPSRSIFDQLSGRNKTKYINSYYDIVNGQKHNVISNIIHLLGWTDFNCFSQDLREMTIG